MGDRVGVGTGTEQVVEGNDPRGGHGPVASTWVVTRTHPYPVTHVLLAHAIFESAFSRMNTPAFLKPSHSFHLPAYE